MPYWKPWYHRLMTWKKETSSGKTQSILHFSFKHTDKQASKLMMILLNNQEKVFFFQKKINSKHHRLIPKSLTAFSEFSNIAWEVLCECYAVDDKKTSDLLMMPQASWDGLTCIDIAVYSDNKRFLSHTACQSLLNNIWMGNLSTANSAILVRHHESFTCLFIWTLT